MIRHFSLLLYSMPGLGPGPNTTKFEHVNDMVDTCRAEIQADIWSGTQIQGWRKSRQIKVEPLPFTKYKMRLDHSLYCARILPSIAWPLFFSNSTQFSSSLTLQLQIDIVNGKISPLWSLFSSVFGIIDVFTSFRSHCFAQALPNQATVDYPSFKLVIVGDGGTGMELGLLLSFSRYLSSWAQFAMFV